MIFNSDRPGGKQPDNKGRSFVVRPGSDVRTGNTSDKNDKSIITPTGKKTRKIIEVDGRLKIA